MVRTATDATTGELSRESEGHLHLPPAGVVPVFAELSRIKSVIGIKYPKMKFFLEIGSREGNPDGLYPQGGGWLGSVHEEPAVGKWFSVNAA